MIDASAHPRAARGPLGIVVVLAVLSAVLGVSTAAAQQEASYPDVPADAYYAVPVGSLGEDGVFVGTLCDDGFCPDAPIDRKTMAVWIVRVLDGAEPSPVSDTRFADVDAGGFYAPFIERMAELGVTEGCGDGSGFCPHRSVPRAQMAVFLSRAYDLADGPDPGFGDVPTDAWYAAEVAELAASGITLGCGDGTRFCPDRDTTRAEMATFLHRAVGLVAAESVTASIADAEAHMVKLVNELRESLDIAPLEQHDGVAAVARRWSNTMHENDEFEHNPRFSGEYPAGSVSGGENIGKVSYHGDLISAVERAFDGLSDSPGHYWNMTRPAYGQIGVGIAIGSGYVWVTQNFACYPKAGESSCNPDSGDAGEEDAPETVGRPQSEFWERNSRCDDSTGDPRYSAVSVGSQAIFALRLDGTIACFGFGPPWTPTVPGGQYTSLSLGGGHVCALRTDSRIACWSLAPNDALTESYTRVYNPAATAPAGQFLEVASGSHHSCGLRTDGTVTCWGFDTHGETEAPSGAFTAVTAGTAYSCGIRTDQSIACWGDGVVTDAPEGAFAAISGDDIHACGLRIEGTVECWGGRVVSFDSYDQVPGNAVVTNDAVKHSPGGTFDHMWTGTMYACGIRPDGSTQCWGQEHLASAAPDTPFTQISVGSGTYLFHACGLGVDQAIVCWNSSRHWRNRGSSHVLQGVSALASTLDCFIRVGGAAVCGDTVFPGSHADAYSDRHYRVFQGGRDVTCLLSAEGSLSCSGGSSHRQFFDDVPGGVFVGMSVYNAFYVAYACGLRPDGTLACWSGRSAADFTGGTPEGMFTLVDVSDEQACALSDAGSIECWGNIKPDYVNTIPDESQEFPTPPEGVFVDVSVSGNGACAVRPAGSVVCWSEGYYSNDHSRYEEEGFGYYVADDPANLTDSTWSRVVAATPEGEFTSVSRTDDYVCGLHRNGSLECWGNPKYLPPHQPRGPFVEIEGHCGRRQDGSVDCYGWVLPAGVTWNHPAQQVDD